MATLLSIVQDAYDDIGDSEAPISVVGNNDPGVAKALRRMNKIGRYLARTYRWPETKMNTYTFDALTDQVSTLERCASYNLPSDYQRFSNLTQWDRTSHWPLIGPATDAEWQTLTSGIIISGVRMWFRVASGYFWLSPIPTSSRTIAYEYQSNAFCQSAGSVWQTEWLADSDTPILDEELFTLGLVWELKRTKGLPCDAEQSAFMDAINSQQFDGNGQPLIDTTGLPRLVIGRGNLPQQGFGTIT